MPVKSTVEISQNFVAFSEYMNFNNSFTTRLIILRKVSFKLPVFQSILEMLVFYHSENTGLVSRGYSEQI